MVNNSITTSGTVSIKDANGATFRNVACNTVQDFSISLQPAGNYFNDINWDVTPNNNGDLFVESSGSYGNATLKSRSNFIPSGSYRIDAGCHAGQGNIGAATPYYINISTPAPTLPYVTLGQVCRNTTVLVHAGSTPGSTNGYQQTEFEIDPTSPALFNGNQQKTIVRNTGNVNVDINATTPNAVVKVRCRNIFSCGTSDWSPYLSIDIFDVNPLSLVNTTGNTYACANQDLDLQLNLETAANLVNGATITYEIVGSSPARILDLRTSPATQTTSLTYTLPNITVKPNGATSDIVVRARVNYPCRQTSWVTATFTVGAIATNNLAITPLNLETTCLDNVELEAVGVNLAEIESIVWSAAYYRRFSNNSAFGTSYPLTSFIQSGLKGNKLLLDVTGAYDLPRVDYFTVSASITRCGVTDVQGAFVLTLLGKNACSVANLNNILNSICLSRDPKCDNPFEPSPDLNPNLTGVNNQINKGQVIEVYPNPSYDHPLTLKVPPTFIGQRIEVFNSTGQLVQTIIAQEPEQKLDLPKGIYMLKVQGVNDASVKVLVN